MYRTINQINSEFKDEWVLIIDCQYNANNEMLGGYVVEHNKDRHLLNESIKEHTFKKNTTFAIKYIGEAPRDKTLVW